MSREFDIVVWGATGFTGRLVAEYVCERYGAAREGGIRWAIAGRNASKLDALKSELKSIDPDASKIPVILGDSHDGDALRSMARRTTVVITTVGPYALYGSELVAACIDAGADYCDLTGESPWIRKMIDAHNARAMAEERRIVHCCGFDSIPSDIGTLVLQEAARERFGAPLSQINFYMGRSKGGISGGTLASMMTIFDQAKDPAVRKALFNPYGLNPEGARKGPDGRDPVGVRWDDDVDKWAAPFVMGPVNTRVVRRSNALMDFAYGEDFRYQEYMTLPKGPKGWLMAQSFVIGLGTFMGLAAIKPIRALLRDKILPGAGEGPSKEIRETGYFNITLVGKGRDTSGRAVELRAEVRGKRDPGYGATARMLTEAALCLARDRDALPPRYGILTPASAMGMVLVPRLAEVDVVVNVAA